MSLVEPDPVVEQIDPEPEPITVQPDGPATEDGEPPAGIDTNTEDRE